MNSKQRLLEYLNFKGISKREFYRETGISNGYLNKTENLSANKLAKVIIAYPDINLFYIVIGVGNLTNGNMEKIIKNHTLSILSNINKISKSRLNKN